MRCDQGVSSVAPCAVDWNRFWTGWSGSAPRTPLGGAAEHFCFHGNTLGRLRKLTAAGSPLRSDPQELPEFHSEPGLWNRHGSDPQNQNTLRS